MSELALFVGQLFNGVSVASIFLLAALGLALSFGLMRVINMAHGEMLMMGGYVAYLTLKFTPPAYGILIAIPIAFVVSGIAGAILEVLLVHRLASRPLDTLLATWGVSLCLQQGARSIFGPIGDEVTAPKWLGGAFQITHGALNGLSLPYARMFIIGFTVVVVAALGLLLVRTRIGLYVRAVTQDRDTAEAMGINIRKIDLLIFSLGTGLAGVAGVVLAMLEPVTPSVGQAYIVPAFLVVILGGLGSLIGTTIASIMVGLISAMTQIVWTVSLSQVFLLLFVVAFIQFRPRGVISVRSRALEET